MPKSPNDTPAMFRAPSELVTRAKAHAKHEGVSLSALLRAGVENILIRAESLRPNGALGTFLSGKFESAAKGDTESLRWLFDNRFAALQSADPQSVSAVMLASEAMVFGRLLSSRGDETDVRRLAGAMVQASTCFRDMPRLREGLLAEAVSILEQLAEDGDELASLASQTLIGRTREHGGDGARLSQQRQENRAGGRVMARPILTLKKPKKPTANSKKAGDPELRRSLFGLVGKPTEGKARCK